MVVAALVAVRDNTAEDPSLRVGPIATEHGIPSSSSQAFIQSAGQRLFQKLSPQLHSKPKPLRPEFLEDPSPGDKAAWRGRAGVAKREAV
ncbi:hypothetical protein PG985_003184 [Apiospora marii]|uniref:Uncharacterized protein n=1 Tax=Apiospora marii TaxID=335849 RepID=A0ABR1RUV0_9PEZI